jgi:hypothetical protein
MELQQTIRNGTARPMAWLAVVLVGLILALVIWSSRLTSAPTHPIVSRPAIAISVGSPRDGGPGGQVGDLPPSRSGGPGGQVGDAP